jgi:hypothetical protein
MSKGRYIYIPLEVARTPSEGHCFVNRWWTYIPEQGIEFWFNRNHFCDLEGEQARPSPQCNSIEQTALHLSQRREDGIAREIIFLPVVFEQHAVKAMYKHVKENPWNKK